MFGSLLRREERAVQATPWGSWGDEYNPTWAGNQVDSSSSVQLLTVYGCVRLIADSIATLPLDVLRNLPDGTIEPVTMPAWLNEPVVGVHRIAWITQVVSSLLLDGNAYLAVLYNSTGTINELIPISAKDVTVSRENGRRIIRVHGEIPNFPVLHIPGVMLAGAETGLSPVEAARQSIGLGMAAQEYGARFFGQGGGPDGVIEVPNELPPEKAAEMARSWAKAHNGRNKAHLPGVLQGGAHWNPTGITNEQAQFLETRGFTAAEICGQMFLLDPSDLGIPINAPSAAHTYANLEQRNARRVQVALMPWIVRIETALSGLLARPRYVKFNTGALLRGDTKTRMETYALAIQSRVMTPNEARAFEDWSPITGGDEFPATSPTPGVPNA